MTANGPLPTTLRERRQAAAPELTRQWQLNAVAHKRQADIRTVGRQLCSLGVERSSGFSLIFVSILLAVASLIFVSFLPGQEAGDNNQKAINNTKKLERVEEAMRSFMASNNRRPCPADGQYAENTANFGLEATTPGTCTGGAPSAPLGPDAGTGYIVGGVIPTKTLGLPDDYAYDDFGRRFTYVVDKRATASSSCLTLQNAPANNGIGGLKIENTTGGTVIDNTMYAYIAHGASGYGAFPAQGSTVANRINSGSTDTDMQTNAGVNSSFTYNTGNFTNVRVQKDRVAPTPSDTGFDNLVWFRPDIKNTCCLGSVCVPLGFIVNGSSAGINSGYSIATGDVNGDGIADIIIGAPYASPGGRIAAGAVYVIFGSRSAFTDPFPVSSLNGTNGFELDGATAGDHFGWSVAAGNVKGDGKGSLIIGAPDAAYGAAPSSGSVYVIFDRSSWSSAYTVNTGAGNIIDGVNGFRFDDTTAGDKAGYSVAAGDVNADGKADIIVGAPGGAGGGNNGGNVDVVLGAASWASATPGLTASAYPLDGINGFQYYGVNSGDQAGFSVAAGDVNGDGKADIIVGAPYALAAGSTIGYASNDPRSWKVWSGSLAGLTTDLSGIKDVEAAYYYIPPGDGGGAGGPGAGDGGGDGGSGKPGGGSGSGSSSGGGGGISAGMVYVIYGSAGPWAASTSLASASAYGSGTNAGDLAGWSVASSDINGDGYADVIVGAPGINSNTGAVYVWFGSNGAATSGELSTLDGVHGFVANGVNAGDSAGTSVASANVNGDTYADLLIGAPNSSSNTGAGYVVFGAANWSSNASFSLSSLNGANGVTFTGPATGAQLGYSAASGDLNGDGRNDVIFGAIGTTVGGNATAGSSYVYFGKKTGWPTSAFNAGGL
jgi:FG-GAP repeat